MKKHNPLYDFLSIGDFPTTFYYGNYVEQLSTLFANGIKHLQKINQKDFAPYIKQTYISRMEILQKGIIESINCYMDGLPAMAFTCFEKAVDECGIGDEIRTIHQVSIPRFNHFYRIVKDYNGDNTKSTGKGFLKSKDPLDLFHPPKQVSPVIGINRFSIPGFPCLYISETLHTSFSECFPNRGNFSAFHAISFANHRPLYILDISLDKIKQVKQRMANSKDGMYINAHSMDAMAMLENMVLLQLMLATHTKFDYKDIFGDRTIFFKVEYILPQLLMQWLVKKKSPIDGIRYQSCTGDVKFPNVHNHYNYVLPAKRILDETYCVELKNLFSSTEVLSYFDKKPANLSRAIEQIQKELELSTLTPL